MRSRHILVCTILFLPLCLIAQSPFLPDYSQLKEPISYQTMQTFLNKISIASHIDVKVVGKSVSGRPLYLVHISNQKDKPDWKLFFYAQQHGNEPAGKDALLYLAQRFYLRPEDFPHDVDLWLLPMVNPDGAVGNKRRNDNNADLNRDHQLLSQPETQILHRIFRDIMPHIAVDCHEFTRDSKEYSDKGWQEWPLIMMDCANNPMIDFEIFKIGERWCDQVQADMLCKGYNYTRYYVGGVPPEEELRYSTLEMDDGRNGLAAYGGLSFIIESGIIRNVKEPNQNLSQRISAYIELLSHFIYNNAYRTEDMAAISRSQTMLLPNFIPTNYFWANKNIRITEIPVINKKTGETIFIQTPNFMHDIIIKKSVHSPHEYLIAGETAEIYKQLMDRHEIMYEIFTDSLEVAVEVCFLKNVEDKFDSLYSRYAGRQISEKTEVRTRKFAPGTLKVHYSRRAAMLLEPLKLYGLYQHKTFLETVSSQGEIPVYRLMN